MSLNNENAKNLSISWWGMDGFLIVLYVIVVSVVFYAVTTGSDFILGVMIPLSVITVTTLIFLSYLFSVSKFMKKHHKNHMEEYLKTHE